MSGSSAVVSIAGPKELEKGEKKQKKNDQIGARSQMQTHVCAPLGFPLAPAVILHVYVTAHNERTTTTSSHCVRVNHCSGLHGGWSFWDILKMFFVLKHISQAAVWKTEEHLTQPWWNVRVREDSWKFLIDELLAAGVSPFYAMSTFSSRLFLLLHAELGTTVILLLHIPQQ